MYPVGLFGMFVLLPRMLWVLVWGREEMRRATHNDWWCSNPALVAAVPYPKGVLCKGGGACPPLHEGKAP